DGGHACRFDWSTKVSSNRLTLSSLQELRRSPQFASVVTTGSPISMERGRPHDQLGSTSKEKVKSPTIAQYKLELNARKSQKCLLSISSVRGTLFQPLPPELASLYQAFPAHLRLSASRDPH